MKRFVKNYCTFFVVALLLGCATPVEVKKIEVGTPIEIKAGTQAKPIQFKKIVAKIKRGEKIGCIEGGLLCVPQGNLSWLGPRATLTTDDLSDAFRQELEKANYVVVGNPDALFDDPSEWKAELLVAGLVTEMKANICYPLLGFMNWTSAKGESYMKVSWQIYSRIDRKVVYEVTTEGSYIQSDSVDDGGHGVWIGSFAMAANNLLANKGFHDLVASSPKSEIKIADSQLAVSCPAQFSMTVQDNMQNIRAGVVTVFAGDGHGSGFFITSDGYVLTNYHVIKEAKFVKVKLATGREILGEVVRRNSGCDTALIKVEEGNMTAVPIAGSELNIGQDVYAVGSPLDKDFSTTVSKGIVSGFRVQDNQRYIQSDVNVLPGSSGGPLLDGSGNVIGITIRGIFIGTSPTGLNFFLPIQAAFTSLNLERK